MASPTRARGDVEGITAVWSCRGANSDAAFLWASYLTVQVGVLAVRLSGSLTSLERNGETGQKRREPPPRGSCGQDHFIDGRHDIGVRPEPWATGCVLPMFPQATRPSVFISGHCSASGRQSDLRLRAVMAAPFLQGGSTPGPGAVDGGITSPASQDHDRLQEDPGTQAARNEAVKFDASGGKVAPKMCNPSSKSQYDQYLARYSQLECRIKHNWSLQVPVFPHVRDRLGIRRLMVFVFEAPCGHAQPWNFRWISQKEAKPFLATWPAPRSSVSNGVTFLMLPSMSSSASIFNASSSDWTLPSKRIGNHCSGINPPLRQYLHTTTTSQSPSPFLREKRSRCAQQVAQPWGLSFPTAAVDAKINSPPFLSASPSFNKPPRLHAL
jgi:hypothetical protein